MSASERNLFLSNIAGNDPKDLAITVRLDLWRALIQADNDIKAVQQMMQMFQQNASARLADAQGRARTAWMKIGEETGIDLNNISWEPHPSEPLVVPTGMRFKP